LRHAAAWPELQILDLQSDKVAAVGSRAPRALSAVAATCRRN